MEWMSSQEGALVPVARANLDVNVPINRMINRMAVLANSLHGKELSTKIVLAKSQKNTEMGVFAKETS